MAGNHLRVLVGVPSGMLWHAKFGLSLASLMVRFAMVQVPGYRSQELRVANIRSSILSRNRLDIVKAAEAEEADYLLFLDSDHIFPPDMLHKLLAHKLPVVAANCVTKQIPAQPTARADGRGDQGIPVFSDPDVHGLEQVWRVGTGVMLIHKNALKRIPHSCWAVVYQEHLDTFQGEDWGFCRACEDAGIPIFIDHDVSRSVGHEGYFNFTHDVVGEVQCNPT